MYTDRTPLQYIHLANCSRPKEKHTHLIFRAHQLWFALLSNSFCFAAKTILFLNNKCIYLNYVVYFICVSAHAVTYSPVNIEDKTNAEKETSQRKNRNCRSVQHNSNWKIY